MGITRSLRRTPVAFESLIIPSALAFLGPMLAAFSPRRQGLVSAERLACFAQTADIFGVLRDLSASSGRTAHRDRRLISVDSRPVLPIRAKRQPGVIDARNSGDRRRQYR